ncbi:hypothetical protein O6H91_Y001400 [Diphasiastrum complanatum]|nr:hypothetical protein O6H91_Y001400 [Diphasiastrum complanatum]
MASAGEESDENPDPRWGLSSDLKHTQDELWVEFFKPAEYWVEALPLGNGRLGAMVYGGVRSELIQLNEDSLWSGGPSDWNNPNAAEVLPQVRNLVWEGQYAAASSLSQKMLGPYTQVYQPLGDLNIDFGETHDYDIDSYHRKLDLDTAVVSVNYVTDGIQYTREAFVTFPHQIIVVRIAGSKERSVSFNVSLNSKLQEDASVVELNRIVLKGRCPQKVDECILHPAEDMKGFDYSKIPPEGQHSKGDQTQGMSFAAILQVCISSEAGKIEPLGQQALKIVEANWVVLLLAASSSFDGPFKHPVESKKDPIADSMQALDSVRQLSYGELLNSHLIDYQRRFRHVSLHLATENTAIKNYGDIFLASRSDFNDFQDHEEMKHAGENMEARTSELINLTDGNVTAVEKPEKYSKDSFLYQKVNPNVQIKMSTQERVVAFAENEDPALVSLLFQFGRYLLLASSRPGSFVANLQGIWNKDLNPPWRCVPHLNINLEMNYWPSETCNLSECHQPLFDLVSSMAMNGNITAKVNYKMGGWVAHHNCDIWVQTAPIGGDPVYALWPMGGAWLCLHLWDHYTFSLDEIFLKEKAFPLLKGCVQFLLDWLVEDNKDVYVTNPATSPEHYFIGPDGNQASILGELDSLVVREVKHIQGRLFPQAIGSDGLVMEWAREFSDPDVHHRHMSHLFGLYPGHSLTLQETPDICQAAARSIIKRGDEGPGWSMAWKIALWARLWNADHAYRLVKRMFTLIDATQTEERLDGGGLYGNLFNAHPPFQIDGNFGFTAAIAELLLQSDGKNIFLLPSLPKEKWAYGLITGLKARGGVTVSIQWEKGILSKAVLQTAPTTTDFQRIHYGWKTVLLQMVPNSTYVVDGDLIVSS